MQGMHTQGTYVLVRDKRSDRGSLEAYKAYDVNTLEMLFSVGEGNPEIMHIYLQRKNPIKVLHPANNKKNPRYWHIKSVPGEELAYYNIDAFKAAKAATYMHFIVENYLEDNNIGARVKVANGPQRFIGMVDKNGQHKVLEVEKPTVSVVTVVLPHPNVEDIAKRARIWDASISTDDETIIGKINAIKEALAEHFNFSNTTNIARREFTTSLGKLVYPHIKRAFETEYEWLIPPGNPAYRALHISKMRSVAFEVTHAGGKYLVDIEKKGGGYVVYNRRFHQIGQRISRTQKDYGIS